MNERIRELAKQAGLNIDGYGYPIWGCLSSEDEKKKFLEKFAKLIVIECKQILLDLMLESTSDNGAIDFSLTLINDHFGMEDDEPT